MKRTFIFDFSRVILFPKDKLYEGKLNPLNQELKSEKGDSYNILDHFELNTRLLDLVKQLKAKGYPVMVFTSGVIQNEHDIRAQIDPVFDSILSGKDFAKTKSDPEAYRMLLGYIEKQADEVVFIDDSPANIQAANSIGLTAILYTTVNELEKELTQYFSPETE
jgi:HAD superfamily hydrolase (TIGR01509 family)